MGALHDIYLRPWKAAAKTGLRALMASHNDINGRPCHSNPFLLTKIMREEFGFGDGLVHSSHCAAQSDVELLLGIVLTRPCCGCPMQIASDGHDINRTCAALLLLASTRCTGRS